MMGATEVYQRAGCELAAEILRRRCDVRIRVTGASMAPALWPGDVIAVRPAADRPPSTGDIAVYIRAGKLIVHRVVEMADDGGERRWITRGDALADRDAAVTSVEMLGVVAGIIRDDGSIQPISTAASAAHRLLACAIRHSGLIHRLLLKVHRMFVAPFGIVGSKCVSR